MDSDKTSENYTSLKTEMVQRSEQAPGDPVGTTGKEDSR
jgi:hypothetical protein